MSKPSNPLDLYGLENYLFGTVGPTFRNTGDLSAFDLFVIVIWKANRSKSKIAKRLLKQSISKQEDLDAVVGRLAKQLYQAADPKERLRILLEDWGFLLPMASAILTVLYPDDFTVYDVRVCSELGDFERLANRTFEPLWAGYQDFVAAVRHATPDGLSLRNCDRWLWAKSFADQLESDIHRQFNKS
jgi:hypothetical protein